MTRVIVIAYVPSVRSKRQHVISATDERDAWAKFRRAYPSDNCVLLDMLDCESRRPAFNGRRPAE